MRIGQTRIGGRVGRVALDRLLEVLHRAVQGLNSRAIDGKDERAPLKRMIDVREMTRSPAICASSVMSASVMPSAK